MAQLDSPHISRTFVAHRGSASEPEYTETQITELAPAVVILGEPGIGKSRTASTLAQTLSIEPISAGSFCRRTASQLRACLSPNGVVIDGLDEVSQSLGISAVDVVLAKLAEIGNPRFFLTCRSADWLSATSRHKISEEYGADPIVIHLVAFSHNDAIRFLEHSGLASNAEAILDHLSERGLSDLYGNPLTLSLIAEIAAERSGLPNSKAELFRRACRLLLVEKNRARLDSPASLANPDELLDVAGCAYAVLLISGSIGIVENTSPNESTGLVSVSSFSPIADTALLRLAMRTRLFQSMTENVVAPVHRVIAEYLGAKWLARRVTQGLSKRRLSASISEAGKIPSSLRGIHAWLAHFNESVANDCIARDPYGVLRYGETGQLGLATSRFLLQSLCKLAEEDPYFRSEDWDAALLPV